MQIIVVSRHLSAARTLTITSRHVVGMVCATSLLVIVAAMIFSWLSVHFRLPFVEDVLLSIEAQEARRNRQFLENNLQLMATRLGELQAQVIQLDTMGERLSGAAGVRLERAAPERLGKGGSGGPFKPEGMGAEELRAALERFGSELEQRREDFEFLEFALRDRRVKDRLLPTALPVSDGQLGSPFGVRQDPLLGVRAMHEGFDFVAEVGSPVFAAADGVVLKAETHPEYGRVIDLDHGEGLVTRYAHLSKIEAQVGRFVKRGARIGAVGNSGRSTGSHLHFEVRVFGTAKNPALFLRQGGQVLADAR